MVVAALCSGAAQAWAQSPRVVRGDAAATAGWLATDTATTERYDPWVDSFYGAGSVGWYWTDNLKTEVDVGGGTEARTFRTEPAFIAGRSTYQTTESRFRHTTVGLSQQYQFFHNTWFHPHVAAGVNLTWERQRNEPGQVYFYDPASSTSRVEPGASGTERTSLRPNPFVAVGYKAYLSERAFFRNDFRMAFHDGPNETVLRFGFGFDF